MPLNTENLGPSNHEEADMRSFLPVEKCHRDKSFENGASRAHDMKDDNTVIYITLSAENDSLVEIAATQSKPSFCPLEITHFDEKIGPEVWVEPAAFYLRVTSDCLHAFLEIS